MISASKTARALNCPGSFSLPQSDPGESEEASRGTAIHGFLERYVKAYREVKDVAKARDEALSVVPDAHALACESMDLGWMHDTLGLGDENVQILVEAGYSWDPETALVEFHGEHLKHGDIDGVVTGIADLVLLADRRNLLAVVDYKTGRAVERAQANPQLMTLAMLAVRHHGYEMVEGAIVYVRDEAFFDYGKWDALDMGAHEAMLAEAVVRIGQKRTDLKAGSWCRYCPAYSNCPLQHGLMRAAAGGYLQTSVDGALAQGDLTAVYRVLRELKALTQHLEGQLRNYVEAKGPIDLGNGLEWGPHKSSREYLKGGVLYGQLVQRYGQAVALAACTLEATKGGLKEALREVSKQSGVPLAQLERQVLGDLRKANGVEVKDVVTFSEKPKR